MLDAQEVIELEQRYLLQSYKRPGFVLERGEGIYLYDTEGREYLDMVGGIAVNALGYGDAGMVETLRAGAASLLHVSNLYHTGPHARLAQKLVDSCFADRAFFCNSGTEAVEGAIKFARKWARSHSGNQEKCEIVSFSQGFHGRSMGALAATANAQYREPFEPLIGGIRFAEFNDLRSAEALVGPNTAAVIVEPVQGEGGIFMADPDFLAGLRRLCNEHGAALIFDEIQCGVGRTGTLWAHEAAGVYPDIMTVAKPLGGGLPIGAVMLREQIAHVIKPGDHGSTFAGGPFVTRVAGYVFDRIAEPAFLDRVKTVGSYLGEQLSELATEISAVKEIRGRGLMWGIELHEHVAAKDVVAAAQKRGLLLAGTGGNAFRLVPPLIIQQVHVNEMIDKLRAILTEDI